MAQTEYQNLQSLTQFITPQFVKKVAQLLLSVSLFSIFFSYSSCHSFFLHSFKSHFSTFSSHLLSYIMDKNCIFLICNGILVFLAKTSGFIRFSPTSNDPNGHLSKKIGNGHGYGFQSAPEFRQSLLEKEVSLGTTGLPLENVVVVEEEEYSMEEEKDEENDEKEMDTIDFLINKEDEDEDADGDGDEEEHGLSIEELNKKFDEFIRRRKEEMRIGAQQLVMVQ
ncbi:hypothetical protein HYC85_011563 [Camellia sinensis]|uniref:DUF4408 domain-containing protein n=1 Tax=Camellia sinensis TaxID=4442 RepID=A0A7J7H9E8_CAMSI|nr:hypothetical protein HYC85_011563 [Camellia sinensis]